MPLGEAPRCPGAASTTRPTTASPRTGATTPTTPAPVTASPGATRTPFSRSWTRCGTGCWTLPCRSSARVTGSRSRIAAVVHRAKVVPGAGQPHQAGHLRGRAALLGHLPRRGVAGRLGDLYPPASGRRGVGDQGAAGPRAVGANAGSSVSYAPTWGGPRGNASTWPARGYNTRHENRLNLFNLLQVSLSGGFI
jgi:hypothetical protein